MSNIQFVAATNNAGKMAEIRRILEKMGCEVLSQREAGITLEPDENGATFAENALIKAREIAKIAKKPVIADDSGLCVDALNGEPGVYSARYCGTHGDDEANNDKLLAELSDTQMDKRGAKFVSCVCVYMPDKLCADGRDEEGTTYIIARGECPGHIAFERAGTNGFGYDPIFVPQFVGLGATGLQCTKNVDNRTYAQLEAYEKDAISHRGAAMRELEKLLQEIQNS